MLVEGCGTRWVIFVSSHVDVGRVRGSARVWRRDPARLRLCLTIWEVPVSHMHPLLSTIVFWGSCRLLIWNLPLEPLV